MKVSNSRVEKASCARYKHFLAEAAVRSTRESGRNKFQKLTDVDCNVPLGAKGLRRYLERVEDCERLDTEETHDALSRERFQREEPRKAGEGLDASVVCYKKNTLNVLHEPMLSTASDWFF